VNLQGNLFTAAPECLANLTTLSTLSLSDNPLALPERPEPER
jgi:hypothetical protein